MSLRSMPWISRAVAVDFDCVCIRTLDLEGLLMTKQSVRDKDKLDRLVIERTLAEFR